MLNTYCISGPIHTVMSLLPRVVSEVLHRRWFHRYIIKNKRKVTFRIVKRRIFTALEKTVSLKGTHTPMFIAALVTLARTWKQN